MRRRLFSLAVVAALVFSVLPAGAVPTPVIAKNIELLTSFPDVTALSTAFSTTSPTMYVNTLNGISTFDISTPTAPKHLATLPLPHFENEQTTIGERPDGTKFVLVGLDLYGVTPTKDPTKVNEGGYELIVVDVTNPAAPAVRGRLKTTTSVHTVKCIDATCTYAYSAGASDKGKFSIFDLRGADPAVVAGTGRRRGRRLPAEQGLRLPLPPGAEALGPPLTGHPREPFFPGASRATGENGSFGSTCGRRRS